MLSNALVGNSTVYTALRECMGENYHTPSYHTHFEITLEIHKNYAKELPSLLVSQV